MIKVTGFLGKSIIVNAIQEYNGAVIYSYYDTFPPFQNCYHVLSYESSLKEFCDFVKINVMKKVNENEGLPLRMIILYTNISDEVEIKRLSIFSEKLEKEKMVGIVVVMTR